MLFPKTQRVGLSFNSDFGVQPQFIATKVVVVDKRNSQTQPQIYVLSPESVIETDDLQALKNQFLSGFQSGIFLFMGTLQSIDRQKKLVKLPDEKLISYEYLVVVTHLKNTQTRVNDKELYSGINALIDALRIKKNNSFAHYSRKLPPALAAGQVQILHDTSLIAKPESKPSEYSSDWFFDSDARFYEVQT